MKITYKEANKILDQINHLKSDGLYRYLNSEYYYMVVIADTKGNTIKPKISEDDFAVDHPAQTFEKTMTVLSDLLELEKQLEKDIEKAKQNSGFYEWTTRHMMMEEENVLYRLENIANIVERTERTQCFVTNDFKEDATIDIKLLVDKQSVYQYIRYYKECIANHKKEIDDYLNTLEIETDISVDMNATFEELLNTKK